MATYYNLDSIELSQIQYTINPLSPQISVHRNSANELVNIRYYNPKNDSTSTTVKITRLKDSTVVFNNPITTSPNDISMAYNYSTLSNVTDTEVFKTEVTTSTGTTISTYFNPAGNSGVFNTGFAFAISILLLVIGITIVSARFVFSFFGIIICFLSFGFLWFAIPTWYTIILQALEAIILAYVIIIVFIFQENPEGI
jgi:hypothetical protein